MAKIEKIKKGTATIYPATIPQAVIDPTSGKSVRTELDEKAKHGYESNPKTLKSVDDAKADHGYDVEETPKTLKEVEGLVVLNEEAIAAALASLNNEIASLNNLLAASKFNKMQIETLDVISEIRINGSPLIYVRDSAPSFSPDQVPQFYIDTSAGRLYTAKGAGSANDWF